MKRIFFVLLFSLIATALLCQRKHPKTIRGYNFQSENDVFSGLLGFKNEDKDYSGSFKFEFYTDYLNNGIFPFFKNRSEDRRGHEPTYLNFNSIYVAGMGFTPNRNAFAETRPVVTQRPYGSLIGIGRRRVAVFNKDALSIESDLFIGQIGTKGAGKVQNFLHEYLTNSDYVAGWPNQIGNGGRWVGNYRVRANIGLNNRVLKWFGKKARYHDVNVYAEPHVSVGNVFVNTGLGVSLTDRDPQSKCIFTAMGSNNLNVLSAIGDAYKKMSKDGKLKNNFLMHFDWELYAKYQYVFHNTLLMGLPFRDNSIYVIPDRNIYSNVYDFGAKVMFNYYPEPGNALRRHTTAYFEVVYRSKEFSYHTSHVFGNIGVTIFLLGQKTI